MAWKRVRNKETGQVGYRNTETGEVIIDQTLNERANPMRDMSALDVFRAGVGKSFADTLHGAKGLLGMEQESAADRERYDAPLMDSPAGMAGNFVGLAAQMGAVPGVTTVPRAMALGGAFGATRPADDVKGRAINTAAMGAGGGAGQMLGRYLATGVGAQLDDFEQATIKAAQDAAKRLGGKLKLTAGAKTGHEGMLGAEESMKSFLLTSRPMHKIADHNQKLLNQAALKAIGQEGKQITPNHIGRAYRDLGKKFDEFESIEEMIPLGKISAKRMQEAADDYASEWGKEIPNRIPNTVKEFWKNSKTGISGKEYVKQRKKLSKSAYKQMTTDSGDRELGLFLHEAVDTLDDAALKVAPAGKVEEYARLRDQYRNLKEVTRFVDKKGNLRGPAMATRLAQKDTRYQRGEAPQFQETEDLHALVRFAGQHQPIVGDSGTATRNTLPMVATGLSMAGGSAPGAIAADPIAAVGGALAPLAAIKGAQSAYLSGPGTAALSFPGLLGQTSSARMLEKMGQLGGAAGAGVLLGSPH